MSQIRVDEITDEAGTGAPEITDHYKKSNILGTVSESGGVPTGAIIERGSNSNGDFVKYADGTMICFLNASSGASGNGTNTLPSAFVDAGYRCSVLVRSGNAIPFVVQINAQTTTSVDIGVIRTDQEVFLSVNVDLIVIGHWY